MHISRCTTVLSLHLHKSSPTQCCQLVETVVTFFNLPRAPMWVTQPHAHCLQGLSFSKVTQQRSGRTDAPCAGWSVLRHLIVPVPPSPHPGHLSDCNRAPPAKDPTKAGAGPAAASDPCGKAVQTQQPCSVRASLSADICSGLASDGGGAHGPGDSQLARL